MSSFFSIMYRLTRAIAITGHHVYRRLIGKGPDLEPVILWGDHIIHRFPNWLKKIVFQYPIPNNIGRKLYDLQFPSPIVVAAFKDDLILMESWLKLGVGGFTIKTLMAEKRDGNPRPRIQSITVEGQQAIINAMGLPSKGLEATLIALEKSTVLAYNRPVGISLGGHNIEEYQKNAKNAINAIEIIKKSQKTPKNTQFYIEINISCPNTKEGQSILKNPSLLKKLLTEIRPLTSDVIGVKLSPDQSNDQLLEMTKIIKDFPKMYICLGNTSFRKCQDISIGGGGLSGPPLFNRTIEMIQLLKDEGVPIIATGGIHSVDTAKKALDAGATLIGMASALVMDPFCVPKINRSLITIL